MPTLPLWWFLAVALSVAGVLLCAGERKTGLTVLHFSVFTVNIWIFPNVAGLIPPAGQMWQYQFWGQAMYILEYGSFNADIWVGHSWPAPAILWSTLAQVLGKSDPQFFVSNATWMAKIFVMFPVYVLFRHLLDGPRERWAGMLVFCVGLWSGQPGITMQSLGFLLFTVLLALVVARETTADRSGVFLLTLVAALTLVLSHLLSALWGFLSVACLHLLKHSRAKRQLVPVLILIVFSGTWMLCIGTSFSQANLPFVWSRMFSFAFLADFSHQVYGVPSSAAWHLATLMKSALILTLVALAAVSGIMRFSSRGYHSHDLALVGASVMMAFTLLLIGPSYSPRAELRWETFHRLFLFLTPLIGYFCATSIEKKHFVFALGVVIVTLAPFSYVGQFGPDYHPFVSSETIEKYRFVTANIHQANIVPEYSALQGFAPTKRAYRYLSYEEFISGDVSVNGVALFGDWERRLETIRGNPHMVEDVMRILDGRESYNLLYASGQESLYNYKGVDSGSLVDEARHGGS